MNKTVLFLLLCWPLMLPALFSSTETFVPSHQNRLSLNQFQKEAAVEKGSNEVNQLVNDLWKAFTKHNASKIKKLLASDFEYVDVFGNVIHRSAFVRDVAQNRPTHFSIHQLHYSRHKDILMVRYIVLLQTRALPEVALPLVQFQVFKKDHGSWRLVKYADLDAFNV